MSSPDRRVATLIAVLALCAVAAVADESKVDEKAAGAKSGIDRWFAGIDASAKPITYRALAGGLDRSATEPVKCPENWSERFKNEVLVCAKATDIDATKKAFVGAFSFLGTPGLMWSGSRKGYRPPKLLDWSEHPGTTWTARVSVVEESAAPILYLQDDGMLFVTMKLN